MHHCERAGAEKECMSPFLRNSSASGGNDIRIFRLGEANL